MADIVDENGEERDEEFESSGDMSLEEGNVIHVSGMYEDWFLDYASYVILERAVPHVNDGLKPVQRRLLHSLKELDDGRFNKVANVVGNTMKYHPHGDASIADALVSLGQKDLLIDTQGNWGNILTGDRAAAPRYIEARLSKFANDVVFNPKTTEWQLSYDGRNKEPVTLPVKFPLLLAQGVEGIAVGLSCKILPHNFIELIDASIKVLQGKSPKIYPDFPSGGMADFANYNQGERGGKVRVRARINALDKKTLVINELPYATTTTSLIDSILKANDKGKIKIKKIEDNTAEFVEILIHLAPGVSPDKTIDALYAFTDCESSISPNAVIIENDKPRFVSVTEILKVNTEYTKDLLQLELEIRKGELQEQWHFASLERIFIEQKIYIKFDGLTYDEAIVVTHKELKPHIKHLKREVTDEDVKRLLEIRMRRITKHDSDKADEIILNLEEQLKEVQHHLDHLVEFAINYFKELKRKHSEGRERKTEIKSFETIERAKVAVANVKLYVNLKEGFAGTALKRTESEYVCDCSDIDDIIVIRKDGKMMVSRIADKAFFGKDILHIQVWKKGDQRTTYNLIYFDGKSKYSYVKRFNVTSITRDKEYDLAGGDKASKILYLTANPNGEAESIKVLLKPRPNVKKLRFDFDFAELAIKGRGAKGNILTKHLVHKIELKEAGISTLSARKIWWDDTVSRLNSDGRGKLLGEFKPEDKILSVMDSGHYKLSPQSLSTHFDDDMMLIEKYEPNRVYSLIYYDGEKEQYYVKRFNLEDTDKKTLLISEHEDSRMEYFSSKLGAKVKVEFDKRSSTKEDEEVVLHEFISVKGQKAQGNRLTTQKVKAIVGLDPIEMEEDLGEQPADEEVPDNPENPEVQDNAAKPESEEEKAPSLKNSVAEVTPVKPKAPAKPKVVKETPKAVPKPAAPKAEAPKVAPPKEEPKAAEPKKVAPKKEVPKKAVPKPEAPKKEAPKVKATPKPTPKEEEPPVVEAKEPESAPESKGDDDDQGIPPEGPVQITLDF
ncbi:DNA gyrase/topoisomerase IV subunit A [bacterium SCSIO 12741]|nr:DNA gyrase/topoisomerase IV subunit A [bacterium SCSIO 12741]